jgi:hypothetical protein
MARRRVPERFPDDEIGWRDEQGRLVRCQPPVHLSARPLTWDEVSAWAHRWQVPEDAVREWWERPGADERIDQGHATVTVYSPSTPPSMAPLAPSTAPTKSATEFATSASKPAPVSIPANAK